MASKAPRVMVIDDDDDARELLAELLRLEGFDVVDYENGESAIDAIRCDKPSVLVTDVTLTGMSGTDVAREMRSHPSTAHVPVVAVTGYQPSDLGDQRHLFDRVLVKPVDSEVLADVVRELLRASREEPGDGAGPSPTNARGVLAATVRDVHEPPC